MAENLEFEISNLVGMAFSKEMRFATRNLHKMSDALVNAKLFFALANDKVWADGLIIFYEIFKYLERNTSSEILPLEYHRTQAFEDDLKYYLGERWKINYKPRPEVQQYLNHLKKITKRNRLLLVPYCYHLYMGLLSGGQLLQKKRSLVRIISTGPVNGCRSGESITYFENYTISELKKKMRHLVDELGETLDNKTKSQLLEESKIVFQLNNHIIRTVRGVNEVGIKHIIGLLFIIFVAWALYRAFN